MAFQGYQGSTVLAYTSLSNLGNFYGSTISNNNGGIVRITLWATSDQSTSFPSGDWKKVGDDLIPLNLTSYYFDIGINNTNFNDAKSFAVWVHTPVISLSYASVDPISLQYYIYAIENLKEDSAVGYCQWLAMDGGYSG
jgi:hypothetical protein